MELSTITVLSSRFALCVALDFEKSRRDECYRSGTSAALHERRIAEYTHALHELHEAFNAHVREARHAAE